MGKDKKKDKAKALKKKEAKAKSQGDKAARRAEKQRKRELAAEGEDDIEAIIAELAEKEAKKTAVVVRVVEQPSARAGFSICRHNDEMLFFGGEYFDGDLNLCFNDMYRYHMTKGEWKQISSPMSPIQRCSHQAAVYKDQMYVFAGEFATTRQFYHHRDLWRFSIPDNAWTKIAAKGGPSARSGHRMIVWKHYLVVFGGFYEAVREHKWFNDIFFFDLQTEKWMTPNLPKTAQVPAARSGHAMVAIAGTDDVLVYGGYSEVKVPGKPSKGMIHNDMWLLHLAPIVTKGVPVWERIRQTGSTPPKRTGFAMAPYKDRVIMFGGVSDRDLKDELESEFYDDLYSFDVARRRWFKLSLKKAAGPRTKRRAGRDGATVATGATGDSEPDLDDDDDDDGSDEDIGDDCDDGISDNVFYYWEDGVLKRMEIEDEESDGEAVEGGGDSGTKAGGAEEATTEAGKVEAHDEAEEATKDASEEATSEEATAEEATAEEATASLEAVTLEDKPDESKPALADAAPSTSSDPVPAAGPADPSADADGDDDEDGDEAPMLVPADSPSAAGDSGAAAGAGGEASAVPETPCGRMRPALFIDGHVLYLYGGLLEEKSKEITLDDMWSLDLRTRLAWNRVLEGTMATREWLGDEEVSDDDDDDDDDDEDDDGEGRGSDSDEDDEDEGGEDERKAAREVFAMTLRQRQKRIKSLRDSLGLGDASKTPEVGEKLVDFFRRTTDAWVATVGAEISAGETMRGKELRRKAFKACRVRYEEIWPILEELNELEEEQAQMELESRARDKKRGKPEKSSKKSKRKDKSSGGARAGAGGDH